MTSRKIKWGKENINKKRKYRNDESDSESDDDEEEVWRDSNHIFFYADVNTGNIAKLNKYIYEINRENFNQYAFPMKSKLKIENNYPPIFLHIKSYGGCVFSAISTVDLIKTSISPIYTIIEGYAASAATMISIVGTKRFIHQNAQMLIHQMSSEFWGKMEEIKDEMENLNNLEEVITDLYKEYTQIPDKKYKKILKHDLWWNAKKCIKYNLVDEII